MTGIFLSHLYSLIPSIRLYGAHMGGWDVGRMYDVEDGALELVFGSLLDFVTKRFRVIRPGHPHPVLLHRDET